ncbi:hypothetical protein H7171_00095 [Candidatus Saccharibacteria bacterium]|nr:hypothetical protein [Candidatus Saccharibacteria bacterium]
MDSAQNQIIEKLQSSTNILVTVSRNPTVDQLAACIGATLLLNKLGKHATAVFSGQVPSTIEFLQPESTLEKTTDSLRDFIIALDKTKADKLRYKVEDDMVRIFITPYRTSITQADLEFSQGDFNVDLVLAIGVHRQEDLDDAIIAHGRILHDAVVTSINTAASQDKLGTINWTDPSASSLAELVANIANSLDATLLDQQIATALLTGIVAETERFSNEKTTPKAMSVSALLMSAGANQQLVATQLAAPVVQPVVAELPLLELPNPYGPSPVSTPALEIIPPHSEPGMLEINHDEPVKLSAQESILPPVVPVIPETPEIPNAINDDILAAIVEPTHESEPETQPTPDDSSGSDDSSLPHEEVPKTSRLIFDAPQMGGTLTANTVPEPYEQSINTLPSTSANEGSESDSEQLPEVQQTIINTKGHDITPLAPRPSIADTSDEPEMPAMPGTVETQDTPLELLQPIIEPAIEQPLPPQSYEPTIVLPDHLAEDTPIKPAATEPEELHLPVENQIVPVADLDDARDEVTRALNALAASSPEPIDALNAQPVLDNINSRPYTEPSVSDQPLVAQPAFADALQQVIPTAPGSLPPAPADDDFVLPMPLTPASDQFVLPIPEVILDQPVAPHDMSLPAGLEIVDPNAPPPVPPPFNFSTSPSQTQPPKL